MGLIMKQAITGPAAWKGADMVGDSPWLHHLSTSVLATLEAALAHVQAQGLTFPNFGKEDFPIGDWAQHLQAQRLQAVCASGGASSQDQIGLERDDALDVRVQPTAHARHRLDRLGPVGIAVQTHEFVALVQGADGFGEGRQQAHDALRGLVDLHFLLAIIEHGDGVCGLQYCAQKETGQRPQKPKFRRSREGGNPDA